MYDIVNADPPPPCRWSLIVPSDGASSLLIPLIAGADEAVARILVWTAEPEQVPDLPTPPPVTLLFDTERPKSITRWWLRAIDASPTDIVLVVNDDVELLSERYLARFADAFAASGATMGVVPGAYLGISGWCYALDRSHGLLPDPAYLWHISDHDLYRRAQEPPGRGIYRHVDPYIRHRKFRSAETGEMREQVARDGRVLRSRSVERSS